MRPIGMLDSGIGGVSVLRHLRELLPDEDVLYVADSAWCPYGPRPAAEIRRRVFALVDALIARRVKLVVVACNTASTVALAALRRRYPGLPFVGMEPAVKPAAELTANGAIGVLATRTTAKGEALARLVDRFGHGVAVHVAVPEGLVEAVEDGEANGSRAEAILRPIVEAWRERGVDAAVLGCTHYPFAREALTRLAGPGVALVDPGPAVARQAARVLPERGGDGRTTFLTTGDPAAMRDVLTRLAPLPWVVAGEYVRLEL